MSKLSTKIESARIAQKEHQRKYSEDYRRAVWTVMIAYGGAFVPKKLQYNFQQQEYTNYYSGRIVIDEIRTRQLLPLLTEDNIDWDNLNDPAETVGYEFNGTFASGSLEFGYLHGELKFEKGEDVIWLAQLSNDNWDDKPTFGNLIQVLQLDITLDDAVEHLTERVGLTKLNWRDAYGFTHATIPKL